MARVANSNYSFSPFVRATSDADAFDRDDINLLAAAVDGHDHRDTKGLPVGRVDTNAVHTAGIQDNAITDVKVGTRTVNQATVPADNIGTLTELLSELANRIRTGFGTTNWYDTPATILTGKVSKAGDAMTGALSITKVGATPDATLYAFSQLLIQNLNAADAFYPSIGFHNQGETGHALYVFPESLNNGYPFRAIGSDGTVARFATDKNGGAGSGFNADMVDSLHAGNGAGQVAVNNGALNTNLYAQFARTLEIGTSGVFASLGNASNNVPLSNGVVNTSLNADTVDGLHAGSFLLDAGDTATGQIIFSRNIGLAAASYADAQVQVHSGANPAWVPIIGFHRQGIEGASFYYLNGAFGLIRSDGVTGTFWHSANDGAASGLDADLLDGIQGSSYARSDAVNPAFSANRFISSGGGDGSAAAPLVELAPGEGLFVSGANEIGFSTQSTQRGRIQDAGKLIWQHEIDAVAFNPTSDKALKQDIYEIGIDALDIIKRLPPVTFRFKNDPARMRAGFIAQDVKKVYPVAVGESDGYLNIDIMAMIALHTKAIKELEARISV